MGPCSMKAEGGLFVRKGTSQSGPADGQLGEGNKLGQSIKPYVQNAYRTPTLMLILKIGNCLS